MSRVIAVCGESPRHLSTRRRGAAAGQVAPYLVLSRASRELLGIAAGLLGTRGRLGGEGGALGGLEGRGGGLGGGRGLVGEGVEELIRSGRYGEKCVARVSCVEIPELGQNAPSGSKIESRHDTYRPAPTKKIVSNDPTLPSPPPVKPAPVRGLLVPSPPPFPTAH